MGTPPLSIVEVWRKIVPLTGGVGPIQPVRTSA